MLNIVVFVLTILIGTCTCVPPSVSKHYRDYDYNEVMDAFYKLHVEARKRRDAKIVCEVEGATLMVPEYHEDIFQVFERLKRYPDLGQYVWVGSEEQDKKTAPDSANSDPSGENQYDPSTLCDVITRTAESNVLPCFKELPFICKVYAKDAPYDSQCDVFARDYHYNATVGNCYSIRRWVTTWDEAKSECSNEGAQLVVLNSELEKEAVRHLMSITPRVEGGKHSWYYYAGFRANKPVGNETRVFKTIFNKMVKDTGYSEWTYPEPNNVGGNEHCGSLFMSDGKLNDVTCEGPYAFICEKQVGRRT